MALVTKNSDAHVDASTAMMAPQLSGDLIAGEDLDSVAPCRIHTDGKVYMSDGSAADAEAKVDGFTPVSYKAGMAVTLYGPGTRFSYGTGLTPGANLYLHDAADGKLNTAATTGGTAVIARAVSATDIVIMAKQ